MNCDSVDNSLGGQNSDREGTGAAQGRGSNRPFVGVLFDCCGVYARVYRQPDESEYVGRCPRCMAQVRLQVGPGGTTQRIFRAR